MASPAPNRISKKQAAKRLGCSTKKIDRLRKKGELLAVKSSREQQGHVEITLDSLEAYEQRQLQAAQPRPAFDDLKARFPIPEQDRERKAKGLEPWQRAAAASAQPQPNTAPGAQTPTRSGRRVGQAAAAPSGDQLAQAEKALRKRRPGASKAVGGGVHMRLDSEGCRRFQFRARSGGHGCRSGQPGGTYDSWQAAYQARLDFEHAEAEAGLGISASGAAMRHFEIDLYAEKVWWPDCTIHLAAITRRGYRDWLKNLLPHIKGITLAQLDGNRQLAAKITHALVAAKTHTARDGDKPEVYRSAVDHALQVLSVICEHAVEGEVIAVNPLAGRRHLNRRRGSASKAAPSHRPILKSEVKLPHTAALVGSGMRGDPALVLQRRLIPELIVMGMRPSDILAMRPRWWRDKHGPRPFLHIDSSVKDLAGHLIEDEPKTGERDLYLIPAIGEWLETLYQLQGCPDLDSLNFPNRNGSLLDWGNFRTGVWYPALRQVGITDSPKASDPEAFYPYMLRHVGVTLMARAERPEGGTYGRREVADQFGHTVGTLDRVYDHVLKDLDGLAGLTMDQVIRKARRHVWGPLPGDSDYQEIEHDLLGAAQLTGVSRNALAARIQRRSIPGSKRKGKCYVTEFDLAWHGLIPPAGRTADGR